MKKLQQKWNGKQFTQIQNFNSTARVVQVWPKTVTLNIGEEKYLIVPKSAFYQDKTNNGAVPKVGDKFTVNAPLLSQLAETEEVNGEVVVKHITKDLYPVGSISFGKFQSRDSRFVVPGQSVAVNEKPAPSRRRKAVK